MTSEAILKKAIPLAERGEISLIRDIDNILNSIAGVLDIVRTNKQIEYYNIPCSFDIETTSSKSTLWKTEKVAFMYEWSFCILGYVIIGRTWDEFKDMITTIIDKLNLSVNKRLIIYVHNLGYEFQFIRKHFEWEKVFSLKERKPIQAVTLDGIEFRCSYLLSGYSLEKLAEHLQTFDIKKLKGDLDYNLVRTSKTPLTKEELQYCINDVVIVVCYIQELINRRGDISKIPLTKTGFVRNYCRENCLYNGSHNKDTSKFHKYRELMNVLTLNSKEYLLCREVFAGGFTHANPYYVNQVIPNVTSFDECSAYPYVMISEMYPMSKPELVEIHNEEELDNNLLNYCCMFYAEFENLESTIDYDNYISKSHCRDLDNPKFNNGRVVSADKLVIALTEQDYFIIYNTYTWTKCIFYSFYRFRKNYLPTDFVKSILKLYNDKTKLKGVHGQEAEYLESKEELNACYGMTVTDICRDEIKYNSTLWKKEKADIDKALEKNNKSVKRFLYYPWGVWVTAYARTNLWLAINECKDDYIYSDTDSVKIVNADRHKKFFKKYNNMVVKKLDRAMDYHGLDKELTRPKTIKGVTKQLGIWEKEGVYDYFKTLGAKRYMVKQKECLEVEQNGEIKKYDYSLTVSGLNKYYVIPYLLDLYGDDIFLYFEEGLYIPPDYTGKLTHTYIDEEQQGVVQDYLGNYDEFHELSSIHLEPADYHLDISEDFKNFLYEIHEDY